MYRIRVSSHTDIGDIKKTNQDSILTKFAVTGEHTAGLFLVADGCGGLAYGEEISNLVVTYFKRVWEDELLPLISRGAADAATINALLDKAINHINMEAVNFGSQVESRVGSTLSLMLTVDNKYFIKNVGDSRIYLKKGRRLKQLTQDQSLVADMIRNGELTKKEAKNFKRKNVLTMCIGVFDDVKIYTASGKIKNGDVFVLCCDGLYNKVSESKIAAVIRNRHISFEDISLELRKCIEAGQANDNVSSIVCEYRRVFGK